MNRVFREEKKYLIGMAEALQRSHLLGQVMREDPHNGVHGYRIRSLYFDTVYDEDYHEKLAGIETRRKIRLRCYDPAAGYASALHHRSLCSAAAPVQRRSVPRNPAAGSSSSPSASPG